jgi:predicted permease
MVPLQPWVVLDFFISDNDTLYALFMIAAVGIAVAIIIMATRASRQADQARAERLRQTDLAATTTDAPDTTGTAQ